MVILVRNEEKTYVRLASCPPFFATLPSVATTKARRVPLAVSHAPPCRSPQRCDRNQPRWLGFWPAIRKRTRVTTCLCQRRRSFSYQDYHIARKGFGLDGPALVSLRGLPEHELQLVRPSRDDILDDLRDRDMVEACAKMETERAVLKIKNADSVCRSRPAGG